MAEQVNIFSGRATEYLGKQIAESYGQKLGKVSTAVFGDGEFQPSFDETIRGNTAKKVVAVIPYFGFARQDRKDKPRVSIGAKLMTNLLVAAGVDRIVTMDLHADQIQGFVDIPMDHLYASSIFVPYLQNLNLENLVAAGLMMEQGASSVRAICTHPVFSGNAVEKLSNSALEEIIVSDTMPVKPSNNITILSTAGIFADVIDKIHNFESISEHFKFTTIL
ncbi:MAG: hypothetical protein B7C24_08640 [Bacteroidetes bacterium 4572_77]|nr:MAG: hypothetical protein B7C24_08640 [Bacteroidetes bacterium 4572_77]